jgi:aminoglycoside phosphotransferase (APT) family kinase protein
LCGALIHWLRYARDSHFCADPDVVGTPFFLYDFVPGVLHTNPALPDLTPAHRSTVYSSMAATLARLHSIDANECGLSGFGKAEGFIPRRTCLAPPTHPLTQAP